MVWIQFVGGRNYPGIYRNGGPVDGRPLRQRRHGELRFHEPERERFRVDQGCQRVSEFVIHMIKRPVSEPRSSLICTSNHTSPTLCPSDITNPSSKQKYFIVRPWSPPLSQQSPDRAAHTTPAAVPTHHSSKTSTTSYTTTQQCSSTPT